MNDFAPHPGDDLRQMDARLLTVFVAVAEELHFGRAAARLSMAQPAVSRQVRALEQDLGVDLFVRTTRRVELSPAGSAALPEARRAIRQVARVREAALRAAEGTTGRLTVTVLPGASDGLVTRVLRRMRSERPAVEVTMAEAVEEEQFGALLQGRADVGLVRLTAPPPGLRYELLAREPLCAVLPAGHALAGRGEVDLAELSDEDFAFFSPSVRPAGHAWLLSACRAAGFLPRVHGATLTAVLGMVEAGLGVSVLVRSYQERLAPRGVVFVPLRDRTIDLIMVWAAEGGSPLLPYALDLFRDAARRATGEGDGGAAG
ncbi:LysR substrate-binding domain-containing protein [Streptacidiphilus sp. ASG 303]|uniref:LysR family transcriptional regulator n=1 Tax=Streptacidiphilus sp. ASG 303 TaxID=2896847 RepID=UPI001E3C630F|nr:LysR substrate-binding domain-containing protein [Streptacidiphilus sp. ASG 303]MCD0486360.1 LysR substrate-binding domain-containing protein [Streptacidiphilus sp. ASG 303]